MLTGTAPCRVFGSCRASSGRYSSSDSTSNTSGSIRRCDAVRLIGGAEGASGARCVYSAASGHRGTGSLSSVGGGARAGRWLVPACWLGDTGGVGLGVDVGCISSNISVGNSSSSRLLSGLPIIAGGWRVESRRMESPSCWSDCGITSSIPSSCSDSSSSVSIWARFDLGVNFVLFEAGFVGLFCPLLPPCLICSLMDFIRIACKFEFASRKGKNTFWLNVFIISLPCRLTEWVVL